MNYSVGSLVFTRGREWVVLPGSSEQFLMLRPLGGSDDEITGIITNLEKVEPAKFELPDPVQTGDFISCQILRDALRLGFRSSAGPFRSFGKIKVEPRPYQLIPLLMGLKLNPVRILIADDVGIGKTIEAALIARELLDRGEVERIAVLCPPQLAEQWQKELLDKFHIDAELVLASTAARLERDCRIGESLFDHYPFVVVSMDFIKSDRRRDEFLRTCPELVIVDEAHTCAFASASNRGRHQRHQLVKGLAADPERHIILVTATPHSGKEPAFRSLISFLKQEFENLPEDLSGKENETHRQKLAQHFVQRKRDSIRGFLGEQTRFPSREGQDLEVTYNLSPEYRKFFERVLGYARETVKDTSGSTFHQRVRWWSALALLRSLASSPAAAAATLRTRASGIETENEDEANEIGRLTVLDLMDEEAVEGIDTTPGSDTSDLVADASKNRRLLLEMAREADTLFGEARDLKLKKAISQIKEMLRDNYQPIIFCRFIPTVHYVADALKQVLPKDIQIESITGDLPPNERENRVNLLGKHPKRILVCTDCLSEGINLQDHFNAVFHYDLSWNPTRHEQREGRVDRFGQPSAQVKVITYYGVDNQIDGIVLDVLIRKHKTIRHSLGISVPVPARTDQVIEAIFEGLLLREKSSPTGQQLFLPGFEEYFRPQKDELHRQWDTSFEREKRSRSLFDQSSIKVDEVTRELDICRKAIGSGDDVARFTRQVLSAHGGVLTDNSFLHVDLSELPTELKDLVGIHEKSLKINFSLPVKENVMYINRTHPLVEGLAGYVLETALGSFQKSIARRSGVIRTSQVTQRTTLILCRNRFHITSRQNRKQNTLLAEEARIVGFMGAVQQPQWLGVMEIEQVLSSVPEANVLTDQSIHFIRQVTEQYALLEPALEQFARQQGEELLAAHQRVRSASRQSFSGYAVEPVLPVDVLGIYIYLPVIR